MTGHRALTAGLTATFLCVAVVTSLTACSGQASVQSAPPASTSSATPVTTQPSAPRFPVADPSGEVDAASQHEADDWIAGAVVPPGAADSSTRPDGAASEPAPQMWCKPMAHAVRYWTLPTLSADNAMNWLETHPSQGMVVASASGNPQSGGETNVGGFVVDEPTPMSLEALILTVTPIGTGSGIRADAFVKAIDSVCATPPPGTELGIGG